MAMFVVLLVAVAPLFARLVFFQYMGKETIASPLHFEFSLSLGAPPLFYS